MAPPCFTPITGYARTRRRRYRRHPFRLLLAPRYARRRRPASTGPLPARLAPSSIAGWLRPQSPPPPASISSAARVPLNAQPPPGSDRAASCSPSSFAAAAGFNFVYRSRPAQRAAAARLRPGRFLLCHLSAAEAADACGLLTNREDSSRTAARNGERRVQLARQRPR